MSPSSFRPVGLGLVTVALVTGCGDARPGRPDDDGGRGGGTTMTTTSAGGHDGAGGGSVDPPPPDFAQATRTVLADGRDFGRAVDIEGDRLAVGTLGPGTAKIYLFGRQSGSWSQEVILEPSAHFQYDMDVDLAAGHVVTTGESEADLFHRDGDAWNPAPSSVTATIGILDAVAIDGTDLALTPGSAFESFELVGAQAVIEDRVDLLEPEDFYAGCSVDVQGGLAIVGTCIIPMASNPPGRAYLFRRSGMGWAFQQALAPEDDLMLFGTSVAIDRDTVVVGGVEAAYVFARDEGGVWRQEARLVPEDTDAKGFGHVVDVSGDVVVVGAPETIFDISTFDVEVGAAYVFARGDDDTWRQQIRLEPEMPEFMTGFGRSVAIDGKTIVVGEHVHEVVNIFTAP